MDLLQQLAYYPRVPSRDDTKDSMEIRGEECGMTLEGMSERLGAYHLMTAVSSQFRLSFSVSTLLLDHYSFDSSVSHLDRPKHHCGLENVFSLLTSCLSRLHPGPQ